MNMQLSLFGNTKGVKMGCRVPYSEVLKLYDTILVASGFPATALDAECRRWLKARFMEVTGFRKPDKNVYYGDLPAVFLSEEEMRIVPEHRGLLWFKRFFEFVKRSTFLSGQNRYNWKPDLKWLVRKRNFYKVVSGRYHEGYADRNYDTLFGIDDIDVE